MRNKGGLLFNTVAKGQILNLIQMDFAIIQMQYSLCLCNFQHIKDYTGTKKKTERSKCCTGMESDLQPAASKEILCVIYSMCFLLRPKKLNAPYRP